MSERPLDGELIEYGRDGESRSRTDLQLFDEGQAGSAFEEWLKASRGSYSDNTFKALLYDGKQFYAYCVEQGVTLASSSPDTVIGFIKSKIQDKIQLKDGSERARSVSSLKRFVASISMLYGAADLTDITKHKRVALYMRAVRRGRVDDQGEPITDEAALRQPEPAVVVSPKQAAGLRWKDLAEYLIALPDTLLALRDKAILLTAYDCLLRRSELRGLRTEDLLFDRIGLEDVIYIGRSKTDQEATGRLISVRSETADAIKAWLSASGITKGPVFRGVYNNDTVTDDPIALRTIDRVYKRCSSAFSGHSTRVGGALDLAEDGVDLLALMRAGRWSGPAMPAHYTREINAANQAMIKLSKKQHSLKELSASLATPKE